MGFRVAPCANPQNKEPTITVGALEKIDLITNGAEPIPCQGFTVGVRALKVSDSKLEQNGGGPWSDHLFVAPNTRINFGMSTGRACRASVLTSACLRASGALLLAKRTSRLGKLTRKTWEVHSTTFRQPLQAAINCARISKRAGDGYFSFVKTIGRPPRFRIIWFFAASNSKVTFPLKS